ncbi:hypothetical protein PISMIDRAFT_527753 [Pisolithus microcarpus 441]|uniref:Unplaced genomic scaffold scaffold_60, whole genome shotgun sequence n=1 Tax=Pisolithus microcarpus 441 TaxID=765257 RepID=A0A0C9ZQK7_9AGAM|nr:hypothetical protein PISMIDRAFT_527753 [Pisolithus microcarpus 441]
MGPPRERAKGSEGLRSRLREREGLRERDLDLERRTCLRSRGDADRLRGDLVRLRLRVRLRRCASNINTDFYTATCINHQPLHFVALRAPNGRFDGRGLIIKDSFVLEKKKDLCRRATCTHPTPSGHGLSPVHDPYHDPCDRDPGRVHGLCPCLCPVLCLFLCPCHGRIRGPYPCLDLGHGLYRLPHRFCRQSLPCYACPRPW